MSWKELGYGFVSPETTNDVNALPTDETCTKLMHFVIIHYLMSFSAEGCWSAESFTCMEAFNNGVFGSRVLRLTGGPAM